MIWIIVDSPLEKWYSLESDMGLGLLRFEAMNQKGRFTSAESFDEHLNSMLGTDVRGWSTYTVDDDSISNCETLMMIFVYDYLQKGRHIVLYRHRDLCYLDPESPVAKVDVSLKGRGDAPIKAGTIGNDILVHFFDSIGSAQDHDTGIISESGKGHAIANGCGTVPDRDLTVGQLLDVVGNSVSAVSIFDWSKSEEIRGKPLTPGLRGWPDDYRDPLEFLVDESRIPDLENDGCQYMMSRGQSRYAGHPVRGYMLFGATSGHEILNLGIDDSVLFMSSDKMGLIVMVDP